MERSEEKLPARATLRMDIFLQRSGFGEKDQKSLQRIQRHFDLHPWFFDNVYGGFGQPARTDHCLYLFLRRTGLGIPVGFGAEIIQNSNAFTYQGSRNASKL